MQNTTVLMISLMALLYTSCVQHASQDTEDARQVVIERELPAEYATQVKTVYQHYINLKDALVKGDSVQVGNEAMLLGKKLNGIEFDIVPKEDELRFARLQGSILGHATVLQMEKGIATQRKAFNNLSKDMYSLIVDIGADSLIVYRQYCPMAFNDSGAFWLSDKPEVLNPYFGDAMLTCGFVEEVITVK